MAMVSMEALSFISMSLIIFDYGRLLERLFLEP
jgi:hypothetical protein